MKEKNEKQRKLSCGAEKYIALLGAACILFGLTGCTKQETAVPELLEPVGAQLDTAVAYVGDINDVSVYSGRIVPHVEEIYFTVDGYLEEISVVCGDRVQEGQVLATLDKEKLLEDIHNLEEEIAAIRTNGAYNDKLARLDIDIAGEEVEILKKSGGAWRVYHAKEIDIQKKEAQLRQNQELRELQLENYEENLYKMKQKLSNDEITAPFAGEVVYVAGLKKGDSVQSYQAVVCLADESRLSIETEYISDYQLTLAERICAEIQGESFPIEPKAFDQAEYIKAVMSGEELTSEFVAAENDTVMQSGQFAAVMIYETCVRDVLQIPVNAVYHDEKGKYVYKVTDGQTKRCEVTVGVTTDTTAEILEGLQEGEVVYVKK